MKFLSGLLKVCAMQIPLTVMIIAIAMLASPHAYGQARARDKSARKERAESRPGRPLAVAIVP